MELTGQSAEQKRGKRERSKEKSKGYNPIDYLRGILNVVFLI